MGSASAAVAGILTISQRPWTTPISQDHHQLNLTPAPPNRAHPFRCHHRHCGLSRLYRDIIHRYPLGIPEWGA
jgi:hypothetical protein